MIFSTALYIYLLGMEIGERFNLFCLILEQVHGARLTKNLGVEGEISIDRSLVV